MIGLFAVFCFQFANAGPIYAPFVDAPNLTEIQLLKSDVQEAKELAPAVSLKTAPRSVESGLDDLFLKYATKYAVDEKRLRYIVEEESRYNLRAIGDMDIVCKRTGKPVRSRGILQISECWHPEVSDQCAFDPECSFKSMILLIKDDNTCKEQWTTCRKYLGL